MQGEAGQPDHGAGAELRRRIHDAVKARFWGPLDRFLQDFFAPGVVVHYNCVKEGVPAPGVWLGREALGESIRQVDIEYEWLDVEIFDIVVDGDRAAVRWRAFWRNRGSGAPGAMELAHFLRFNNGLIVEMHEFLDNSSECPAASQRAAVAGGDHLAAAAGARPRRDRASRPNAHDRLGQRA